MCINNRIYEYLNAKSISADVENIIYDTLQDLETINRTFLQSQYSWLNDDEMKDTNKPLCLLLCDWFY